MWILGISQAIQWGVGNGMLAWVCLKLRIQIVLLFDSELHKEVVMKHLKAKVIEAMNDSSNKRFYKSDAVLRVDTPAKPPALPAKPPAPAGKAKGKATKPPKKADRFA